MFGESQMKISVDAGKNIYSYFRDGKWSVLNENLKKFKQVNDFTVIDTVVTTSIYQIMDIENIMMSLLELGVDYITSSIVFGPSYINPALIMRKFSAEVHADIHETRIRINKERRRIL